jgi:hypothetical protein
MECEQMAYSRISKKILLQPEILEAVNNENLVIFIGAGVSRLIGCKGWDQLAQSLVNKCFLTKKGDGSSCINYKERETLSHYRDHKKIITICHSILKRNGFENIFFEELEKSLEADPGLLESQNIYDELYGLRGIFVTTNADQHFDGKFNPSQIVYKKKDFDPSTIDRTKLYHIHGSITDKNSLVFTVPQYIKRYNDLQFKKFLGEIFKSKKYVVLFVGYGMNEFELLDFLIAKFDSAKEKELKHFILRPFFRGEENILEFEESYYNPMGIRVLGYEKDEKGYHQLYEIIKEWNSEISQVSRYLYNSYRIIDDAIENYEEYKVERILQIIRNDKPQEDYFFRELADCNNPFPWLSILRERKYFDGENNPPPQEVSGKEGYFTISHWNVLDYLENVAVRNANDPSDKITDTFIDIIDSISNYQDEEGNKIDNYRTNWVLVKIIASLPLDRVTRDHIEFIHISLKSRWDNTLIASEIGKTVLPYFIDNQAKELLLQLLDGILDYHKDDSRTSSKYDSIMGEFWLEKALKKDKSGISKLCGIEAAGVAIKKILTITNEDESQFNIIQIPAIEDHPQSSYSDTYEYQIVNFIRGMFELSEPNQIEMEIENLLKQEHPIFKRIALHTINYHYDNLGGLFWNWKENPLEESVVKHELYELLRANCRSFTKDQINTVLEWIESKHYYISHRHRDDEELIEKILAYRKKEWLSALLETEDPDIISSYEKYQKINPKEIDHPGFGYWTEVRYGSISPVKEVELLHKSNEEIAEYLITYRGEEHWDRPSVEGLSDTFRRCVSENPEKFAIEMEPFLRVQRMYQYNLLMGLSEAWRKEKDFVWDGILDFIFHILGSDEFWDEEYENESENYRNGIINQIADLIEDGTKNDKHAFDAELLPQTERILLILVEKNKSEISGMNDLVISVWNSAKGKIFSAMINYSLRCARLTEKEEGEKWAQSIKEIFDRKLDREVESSLEFSVILGTYIADINYLDERWVKDNINRIFPKDDNLHWKAVCTGYFYFASIVCKDLYFLLRENGHYVKALQTNFDDIHIKERLVQHICIGYLEDWEELDDEGSLICELIRSGNVDHISAIVEFFSMQRNSLTDKIRMKIKPLWGVLFDVLSQNKENLEYQNLLSDLHKWLLLIDIIDEQALEWLKFSARYIRVDFDAVQFIEYLLGHVSKTPVEVGEIYLEMLNSGVYPEYKKEHIQEIVQTLYDQNQETIANRICNLYGARGFDFLRSIYEEHGNE